MPKLYLISYSAVAKKQLDKKIVIDGDNLLEFKKNKTFFISFKLN